MYDNGMTDKEILQRGYSVPDAIDMGQVCPENGHKLLGACAVPEGAEGFIIPSRRHIPELDSDMSITDATPLEATLVYEYRIFKNEYGEEFVYWPEAPNSRRLVVAPLHEVLFEHNPTDII